MLTTETELLVGGCVGKVRGTSVALEEMVEIALLVALLEPVATVDEDFCCGANSTVAA
jgi:hypothetical protein